MELLKTNQEPWNTMKTDLEPWKPWTGLEEEKSLTDFFVCVLIWFLYFYDSVFLYFYISLFLYFYISIFLYVTNAGSQLTFMTQNEKVMIFRDQRGATTDLHDAEWESDHFSKKDRGGGAGQE